MRATLILTVAGLIAFVLQPADAAAAESGYAEVWQPGSGARCGEIGASPVWQKRHCLPGLRQVSS